MKLKGFDRFQVSRAHGLCKNKIISTNNIGELAGQVDWAGDANTFLKIGSAYHNPAIDSYIRRINLRNHCLYKNQHLVNKDQR